MSFQGYDIQSVARVFNTLLPDYDRKIHEMHLKARPFQEKMDMLGRISYNRGGNGYQWTVEVRRHTLRPYTGNQTRSFEQLQPFEQAALGIAGMEVTDAMSERERAIAAAAGQAKIIDYYSGFLKRLQTSIIQASSSQYFINGDASGNSLFWKGLGTFHQGTQTINSTTTTTAARSKNAADIYFYPSGTYAGLSMVLGTYGGAQVSGYNWPEMYCDPQFDAWSPVDIQWSSTSLNAHGSGHTFYAQGEEVISLGILRMMRKERENGGITDLFLGTQLFEQYKAAMRGKQRIIVSAAPQNVNTGYTKNSFSTDEGVEVHCEYNCTPTLGYGLNFNDWEVRCVLGQMFETQGPFYDEVHDQHRVATRNLSTLMTSTPANLLILRN